MRKLSTILISLIIVVSGNIQGQAYQPFPTETGYWKSEYGNVACLDSIGLSIVCEESQFMVAGDTAINSINYHKISYDGRYRNGINNWTYFYHGYYGCYRNDIPTKKVYFVPVDSTSEVLLYDFDLNLYDTLPELFRYYAWNYYPISIDEIDSVLVGATYLKRYHLDEMGSGEDYLIEGIGSTLGLLAPIFPFFESYNDLLCFKNENEELYYHEYGSGYCDLITSLDNETPFQMKTLVYPNPARDRFTIVHSQSGQLVSKIIIYNHLGRKQEDIQITKRQTEIEIITTHWDSGLYIIHLIGEKGLITTEKLVVY